MNTATIQFEDEKHKQEILEFAAKRGFKVSFRVKKQVFTAKKEAIALANAMDSGRTGEYVDNDQFLNKFKKISAAKN